MATSNDVNDNPTTENIKAWPVGTILETQCYATWTKGDLVKMAM